MNGANAIHEYQNLSSFDHDHNNFDTLPSRMPHFVDTQISRPHSSMGATSYDHQQSTTSQQQQSHTYLNSLSTTFNHSVIMNGSMTKSQPNYYISNPLSCQSSHFDGSKTSLNGSNFNLKCFPSNFDSSTLPPRGSKSMFHHEYVNSNVQGSLDDSSTMFNNRTQSRKNSEQHLYENHEIPKQSTSQQPPSSSSSATTSRSRMIPEPIPLRLGDSDDLSPFCYVNLDLDTRKERNAILLGMFSYFQLGI